MAYSRLPPHHLTTTAVPETRLTRLEQRVQPRYDLFFFIFILLLGIDSASVHGLQTHPATTTGSGRVKRVSGHGENFSCLIFTFFIYIDCMYAYHHHHRHLQVNTQLGLYRPYQPYTKCCQCLVMYCYWSIYCARWSHLGVIISEIGYGKGLKRTKLHRINYNFIVA